MRRSYIPEKGIQILQINSSQHIIPDRMVVQLLTCDRQTSKTHQRPTLEQECFLIKRPNEDYRSVIHLKHLMK